MKNILFRIGIVAVSIAIALAPLVFLTSFACDGLESIYYVLAGFGSLATVGAIFVAISIPHKIAEQQNRIALFEKRYEIYHALLKIKEFRAMCFSLPSPLGTNEWKEFQYNMVSMYLVEKTCSKNEFGLVFWEVSNLYKKLDQAKFLFDFKGISNLEIIKKDLKSFVLLCFTVKNFLDKKDDNNEFFKSFDAYAAKIISKMEEVLTLNMQKIK